MAIKEYKLSEIGNFKNNKIIDSIYHVSTDNMSGHEIPNFYPKKGNLYVENNILMSNIRPYFNKVWIADRKGSKSPNVLCLSITNKNVLPKYIYYLICSNEFNLYWTKTSKGTTMPVGDKNAILDYKFLIPDLQTQQEIINIIEPKESLFLKYHEVVDISDLDKFKESWFNLINIIEPFERLREKYLNKIKHLKSILFNYESDEDYKTFQELRNVSTIKTGKRNADFASIDGKYRFFTCSINKQQFCNTYEYDDEVILLAGNGEIGEIKYYNGKFDAYQRTYIIKTNLIGNVYYSLLKNKKFFVNNSNGSVVKFLTLPVISSIKIDTNKNLNELRYKIIKNIFCYEKIIEKISIIIENLICKFI